MIVRGLYAIATCDDVHQTERVLIRGFYDSCRQDVACLTDFDELVRSEFDAAEAAEMLDTQALRQTFLRSCLLFAFADGRDSEAEQTKLGELARALEVDDATVALLKD